MVALPGWRTWLNALLKPEISEEVAELLAHRANRVPVIWLLGKTGSGKSSIVQRLTGDPMAQIGNGFEPCTPTAKFYDHPATAPVMRFIDTRGLGEANYEPSEDLAQCQQASHVAVIVTRVDDPSQTALTDSLKKLAKLTKETPILHVHSALHAVNENDLARAIRHNQNQIQAALGFDVPQVSIDFTQREDGFDDPDRGKDQLQSAIIELVPKLSQFLSTSRTGDTESRLFEINRKQVLGYASAAAAIDVLPAVGLVAVPSVQGKLLHTLAECYSVEWDRKLIVEFTAALGSSFLYRYVVSLLTRQMVKLIPVYGQSAGAAAAASISFASTYALGRAACLYFYRRSTQQAIDPDALRRAFKEAFKASQ